MEQLIIEQQILISVISGLGAFALGMIFDMFKDKWNEKIRQRSFITVDVIYNVGINLEGYPINDIAKVAYTKTYSEMVKFQDRNSDLRLYCNFIKIKNSDNSSINNLHSKSYQTTYLDGIKDWEVEVNASTLEKSEVIFINTDSFLNNEEALKYSINKIEVNYETSYGERIKYESCLNEDGTLRETYYSVRRFLSNKKILEINNKGIDWMVIPKNEK